jgi:hypothetical protein
MWLIALRRVRLRQGKAALLTNTRSRCLPRAVSAISLIHPPPRLVLPHRTDVSTSRHIQPLSAFAVREGPKVPAVTQHFWTPFWFQRWCSTFLPHATGQPSTLPDLPQPDPPMSGGARALFGTFLQNLPLKYYRLKRLKKFVPIDPRRINGGGTKLTS